MNRLKEIKRLYREECDATTRDLTTERVLAMVRDHYESEAGMQADQAAEWMRKLLRDSDLPVSR